MDLSLNIDGIEMYDNVARVDIQITNVANTAFNKRLKLVTNLVDRRVRLRRLTIEPLATIRGHIDIGITGSTGSFGPFGVFDTTGPTGSVRPSILPGSQFFLLAKESVKPVKPSKCRSCKIQTVPQPTSQYKLASNVAVYKTAPFIDFTVDANIGVTGLLKADIDVNTFAFQAQAFNEFLGELEIVRVDGGDFLVGSGSDNPISLNNSGVPIVTPLPTSSYGYWDFTPSKKLTFKLYNPVKYFYQTGQVRFLPRLLGESLTGVVLECTFSPEGFDNRQRIGYITLQ